MNIQIMVIVVLSKNQNVDNDATLEVLSRVALSHAQAGADIVAPFGYDGWSY
nr:hypothetical protein [endosymbiont 'TC1' of Trimyema compressum]